MNLDGPVVAAIDLGDRSSVALECAYAIARHASAALRVVHVHASSIDRVEARTTGHQLVAGIDGGGVPITFDLVETVDRPLAERLCTVTAEHRARLLVIGASRGELSSVGIELLRRAPCPILIARPMETGPIVAATDFSEPDARVLQAAALAARWFSAELSAIHVVEPWSQSSIASAAAEAPVVSRPADQEVFHAAQRLKRILGELDLAGSVATARGVPPDEILRHAADVGARMIVTGTAGGTSTVRLMLGSVAEAIASRAFCSVLVVRLDVGPDVSPTGSLGFAIHDMTGTRVVDAGGRALGKLVDVRLDTTTWRAVAIVVGVAASTVAELGLPLPSWQHARLAIPIEHVVHSTQTIVIDLGITDLQPLLAAATPEPDNPD